jgi:hypothetical protein
MEKFLIKLKSQRGATGTDVLIAASMIIMTVVVVSMLYVNTSIGSRNITRTAGATRIATNIMENIQEMSYEEFIVEFNNNVSAGDTGINIAKETELTIFGTKIPKGYNLVMSADNVYGSHTEEKEQFDLVRQVTITVKYAVGSSEEQVQFSTAKQRELIGECNEPSLEYLSSTNLNIYPVKYSENAGAYIKTTKDDTEWYNYTNKNWAMVIVSKLSESDLFDVNGKFIGTINKDTSNDNYTQKEVWIPRYFTNATASNKNVQFAFLSTGKMISNEQLSSNGADPSKFYYYTSKDVTSDWNTTDTDALFDIATNKNTGKWVKIDETNTTTGIFNGEESADKLNASQYGPFNIH